MKGSEFLFVYIQLLYYKCHKINPDCSGSYKDSSDWIKNKKAIIPSIKKIVNAFNTLLQWHLIMNK